MVDAHESFLVGLTQGVVAVPGTRRSSGSESDDPAELAHELGTEERPLAEYDAAELRKDVEADLEGLRGLLAAIAEASIDDDPKLRALSQLLSDQLGPEKAIIFTYYADTAGWIERAMLADPDRFGNRRWVTVTGTRDDSPAERLHKVHAFCPQTTVEQAGRTSVAPSDEKDLLLATDVLAEGQNLQQARYIINYDMPWNPMRLVQRNGRIDRLGSPFAGEEIFLYNLFPAGELDAMLDLYTRLLRKISYANVSVGMEAPVFEDAAAVERNFADTAEAIRAVAREDVGVLDEAEAQLDAFSGEEFRMELRAALAAQRLRELRTMPHGAGSGFLNVTLPPGTQGVFFGVRLLLGPRADPSYLDERAWRYVDLADPADPIVDELEILGQIRCSEGTPRELPENIEPTLYYLWSRVQNDLLNDYARRMDPALGGSRVPASQAWAIELLASEAHGLAEQDVKASTVREAGAALSVPRGPLVRRRLSALRREVRNGDRTPRAAAIGVLEVVRHEGLRPVDEGPTASVPVVLTPERVRLICYQVVTTQLSE
jgi:hypothetical protein